MKTLNSKKTSEMKRDASILRIIILTVIGIMAIFQTGCVTGAQAPAMIPDPIEHGVNFNPGVEVVVMGGRETTSVSQSYISNENFKFAVEVACAQAKLFSGHRHSGERYVLAAEMDLDGPSFGFNPEVSLVVRWSLKDRTGKIVWSQEIKTDHTTKFSTSLFGQTRVRIAEEEAARKNISKVIQELSSQKI